MKTKSHFTKIAVALVCVLTLTFGFFGIGSLTASAADEYTGTGTFKQCSGELTSGYYVFGVGTSAESISALNTTATSNWIKFTTTTPTSGTITNPNTSIVWYYNADEGTFKNGTNYVSWTSGNTAVFQTTGTPLTVTETATAGVYNITVTATPARVLRLNGTDGYRFYTSSTGKSTFYFFKLEESTGGGGEETPNCEHTNTTAIGEPKAATCTEDGITVGEECTNCGEPITAQETIPATGHDYVNGTCSVCGEEQPTTLTINRDAFGEASGYDWHSWTATTTTGVTVSGNGFIYGSTKASIQVNGGKDGDYIYNTAPIPGKITSITLKKASGTDRNFDILTSDTPFDKDTAASLKGEATDAKKLVTTEGVTWTFDGGHRYFAIVIVDSSAAYLESIDITYEICTHETKEAIGENVDPGCETTGMTAGEKCADCGEIFKESEILEAKGHNYVNGTCTACGESACNHTNTTTKGEPKAATCTEDGITAGLKCADCDHTIEEQKALPATGHNYDNHICTFCGGKESITLTINRDAFGEASGYAWHSWTATNTTGVAVYGNGFIYGSTKTSIQVNGSKDGDYIYNTAPIPGKITSITLKKASGTDRNFDILTSDTPFDHNTVASLKESATTAKKKVTTDGVTWEFSEGHKYFAIVIVDKSAAYLESIDITFEICIHTPAEDDGDCTTAINCTLCGAETTAANATHTGGSATCTAKAECSVCGTAYGELAAHTPEADDGDCSTAIKCSVCGAETTPAAAHEFNNACDTTCNNEGCSFTRQTNHKYDNACDADCNVCGDIRTPAEHTGGSATCTAKAVCTACGTEYGELLAHDYTVPDKDGTHHWNKCSACGAIDEKASHSGTDDGNCLTPVLCSCGHVITEGADAHTGGSATCTAKAVCTACGTEYGELLEHDYTIPDKDGTHHWNKCSACDATDTRTAHSFTEPQNDSLDHWNKCFGCDATDTRIPHSGTDDGDCTTEVSCSCGTVITEAKAHTWENDCDTDCNNSECNYTRAITHIPAEDDGDCTTAIACTVCGAETTAANAAHTGGAATCTAKAKCSVCDKEYGSLADHIDAAPADLTCDNCGKNLCENHIWTDGDVITDGGCTADTVIAQVCDACGKLGESKTVPAPGHTSAEDDGDCTTATLCTACGEVVTAAPEAEHSFDNACDTSCNNGGCNHTREITHTYDNACDADCNVCGDIRTPAEHTGGSATCTAKAVCTACGKEYGELLAHTPAEDDGDCTTAINCTVCGAETTASNAAHTGGAATCTAKAECSVCTTAYGELLAHTPAEDDGDCTTAINCTVCGAQTTAANAAHTGGAATCTAKAECSVCATAYGELLAHTPAEDDGDCTTAIICTVCGAETTAANAAHTGGAATCTAKAECSACKTAYGELDKNNHKLATFVYIISENGKAHTKKHECCGEVATADEAHAYGSDDKCVCGADKPTYTVTVENGTVEGGNSASAVINEDGTVTIRANAAPDGKKFKGWAVDGKIVSTYPTYTFNATEDVKLEAVYEDINPVPAPTFKQTVIALSAMAFLVLFALAAIVNRKRFK